MSRTDIAANNASSGSPMKVTAAPSPVSRMMRSAAATWSSALASTALNSCLSCSCSATGFLERSEEHTSELQSLAYLVCRLLLEKKKNTINNDQLVVYRHRIDNMPINVGPLHPSIPGVLRLILTIHG